jgi:hypothetical protein
MGIDDVQYFSFYKSILFQAFRILAWLFNLENHIICTIHFIYCRKNRVSRQVVFVEIQFFVNCQFLKVLTKYCHTNPLSFGLIEIFY